MNRSISEVVFQEIKSQNDSTLFTVTTPEDSTIVVMEMDPEFNGVSRVSTCYVSAQKSQWLAHSFDIRDYPDLTVDEAIYKIIKISNEQNLSYLKWIKEKEFYFQLNKGNSAHV